MKHFTSLIGARIECREASMAIKRSRSSSLTSILSNGASDTNDTLEFGGGGNGSISVRGFRDEWGRGGGAGSEEQGSVSWF